jgi:hypothetical protein
VIWTGWYQDRHGREQITIGNDGVRDVDKACICCAWSGYSPAGSPFFGGLACFRDNKDGYRQVRDKRDLFNIWQSRTEYVQETYLCGEFEPRGPDRGDGGHHRTG